ncbi:DUF1501 domain-containing protein [Luteirhabdus pelagi]|uniref:DUF1501 domain-containing protein n=1 Tax=Luteirhabdus pelagi TaxID=2792783 RepID=UPI001939FFF8|nr:DUF1501 domain-containing protein [Luteirhabdus pelagi]
MCNDHHFSPNKAKHEKHHDREHTLWNRRSFLQALGLAGTGSIMLAGSNITANRPSPLSVALSQSENDRILVIIRLKGGNDGLNTIVPIYDYATYANLRPTIRHQENELINLDADFGIPDYLTAMETMWGDGKMKVVHGVGYPEQNLSHFRSSDIWASAADTYFEPTGWWGRYFEELYPDYIINPPETPPAVQIGSIGNLTFEGTESSYAFAVANPAQLANVAENGTIHDVTNLPECVYGDKLLFMRATANTTFTYAGVISDAYDSATNDVPYSNADLAQQLAIVARMIKGGLGTKVYMVTLDGFDTHANQLADHQTLLTDLSESINHFFNDLATAGYDDKVLAMTISEFGRRPYENGSDGTDHGAASPVMLFGEGLNGSGFVGEHPDLNEWDNNDNLIPSTDFRNVYASVLTDWFCLDASVIEDMLLSDSYDALPTGMSCAPLSNELFGTVSRFKHVPFYRNENSYIELTLQNGAFVEVKLFDIMGREIGMLKNELLSAGTHTINVKTSVGTKLSYGHYVYQIKTGGQRYSNKIVIR